MRSAQLQLAAMVFFVAGFVLTSSGWSSVISQLLSPKAAWSVCGEDLCLCVPTTTDELLKPFCPLCPSEEEIAAGCESTCDAEPNKQPDSTENTKRLPKNEDQIIASTASSAACASIFLSFVFGINAQSHLICNEPGRAMITNDRCPKDLFFDVAPPPPRA